jgi:nitroimidazol reductase NimA-like FMN-containing flavoprotein (pyridoxamine 5'-phosphate oxidase superfamily)
MRPTFPKGYVEHPTAMLTWDQVVSRLADAQNYWLCTVRPDGRPHAVPKWGVWVEQKLYFDGSPETRHARNIVKNPRVVVHLESGEKAVILEGVCEPVGTPDASVAEVVARGYTRKYEGRGYAPKPTQWDEGGLYVVTPFKVLAWTNFAEDPTKFVFGDE